ncbi:MAG: cell division transport system permease protein [Actinomycetota bacterium]|jgi:cell division transport system permease protein|nr:cell division transport system permease protein [Actinomycetota bacterium]
MTIGAARGTQTRREPDSSIVQMITVFLDPGVDEAIVQDVERRLRAAPEVRDLRYVAEGEAFAEFRRVFADEPDVRDSLTVEQVPTYFRLRLMPPDGEVRDHIRDAFEYSPGVFRVSSNVYLED